MTPMNESIAHNCRKLKHSDLMHGCFLRNGIVRIKCQEKDRPTGLDKLQHGDEHAHNVHAKRFSHAQNYVHANQSKHI